MKILGVKAQIFEDGSCVRGGGIMRRWVWRVIAMVMEAKKPTCRFFFFRRRISLENIS